MRARVDRGLLLLALVLFSLAIAGGILDAALLASRVYFVVEIKNG